jgi:hypothetical protein
MIPTIVSYEFANNHGKKCLGAYDAETDTHYVYGTNELHPYTRGVTMAELWGTELVSMEIEYRMLAHKIQDILLKLCKKHALVNIHEVIANGFQASSRGQ